MHLLNRNWFRKRTQTSPGVQDPRQVSWKWYYLGQPGVILSSFWVPLGLNFGSFWGTLGVPGRSRDDSGPNLGPKSDLYRCVFVALGLHLGVTFGVDFGPLPKKSVLDSEFEATFGPTLSESTFPAMFYTFFYAWGGTGTLNFDAPLQRFACFQKLTDPGKSHEKLSFGLRFGPHLGGFWLPLGTPGRVFGGKWATAGTGKNVIDFGTDLEPQRGRGTLGRQEGRSP